MSIEVKVNNIEEIWNTPCDIKNGDIVEIVAIDFYSGKYYIGEDHEGSLIWFDYSDTEEDYVEEV